MCSAWPWPVLGRRRAKGYVAASDHPGPGAARSSSFCVPFHEGRRDGRPEELSQEILRLTEARTAERSGVDSAACTRRALAPFWC